MEENNTEDKSKDNVPLDSQSECTNYFLQYISTPRWFKKKYSFLSFSNMFTFMVNFFYCFFFVLFLLVQKMPQTVQTLGQNLFLGRICPSESWWVNAVSVVHFLSATRCSSYEQVPNLALFFFLPQSPPKAESQSEENKEVLPAPASEPSSQEATPEKGNHTEGFKTACSCYYYTHSMLLSPTNG